MNKLSFKQLIIIDIILSALLTGYWLSAGTSEEDAALLFFSIFIAGSPFSFLLARFLPFWRATAVIENDDVSITSTKIAKELSYLDTLVFAKNGTLTENAPYISDIVPEAMTQGSLLSLAASIERDATHKIGKALLYAAHARGLRLQRTSATNEIEGMGMEGIVAGNSVRVGRLSWFKKEKIEISAELLAKNDQLATKGKIPVFISSGKRALGIIAFEDKIPPGLMTAIRRLKKMDIRTMIITGDSKRTANAVKKELNIDEAKGDLTKDGKLREIKLLKVAGKTVGMIGDLHRDQLLLEAADIGIELIPKQYEPLRKNIIEVAGTEEDKIKEEPEENNSSVPPFSPEMILKGGLAALLPAVEIARRAKEVARQNTIIAYLTWILLLPAAMGFFVAFGGAFLSLDLALMGVSISLLLVFLNSLRVH